MDGADRFQHKSSWGMTLPLLPAADQDPHPRQDHHNAHQIPKRERHPVHHPQPNQRHLVIDRSIGGIDPAPCRRVEREQSGEEHQRWGRRKQQERRLAPSGGGAVSNRDRREDEQERDPSMEEFG